jgi:hypothetical protein
MVWPRRRQAVERGHVARRRNQLLSFGASPNQEFTVHASVQQSLPQVRPEASSGVSPGQRRDRREKGNNSKGQFLSNQWFFLIQTLAINRLNL